MLIHQRGDTRQAVVAYERAIQLAPLSDGVLLGSVNIVAVMVAGRLF